MHKLSKAILLTGFFAGTTDILYAFAATYLRQGVFPEKMFHYIAGGALGLEKSMSGGLATAFLGLFFHYFIALSFTAFFFMLLSRLKFLWFDKYLVGMLYGIFVNLSMKLIIFLFTPLPKQPFVLSRVFIDWICFGLVFGGPVVWNAYKFYKKE